jgi:hypothetical protein
MAATPTAELERNFVVMISLKEMATPGNIRGVSKTDEDIPRRSAHMGADPWPARPSCQLPNIYFFSA